jgi:hypothetical protein
MNFSASKLIKYFFEYILFSNQFKLLTLFLSLNCREFFEKKVILNCQKRHFDTSRHYNTSRHFGLESQSKKAFKKMRICRPKTIFGGYFEFWRHF